MHMWWLGEVEHLQSMKNLDQKLLQGVELQLSSMRICQPPDEQGLPCCKISFQHLLAPAGQLRQPSSE